MISPAIGSTGAVNTTVHRTEAAVEPLLTVEDVAELLQVKPRWVYEQVARRSLPYVKLGRFLRFRPSEIKEYLAERAVAVRPELPPPPRARRGVSTRTFRAD